MKHLIASIVLLASFACGAAAKTLTLLADPQAVSGAGSVYRAWVNQIISEGWKVHEVPVERWDRNFATNHWRLLNRMSNAVARTSPDAVQIFGSLPYLLTGEHSSDGHSSDRRIIATDAWLGCTNLVMDDVLDWDLTLPIGASNVPGDGKPDLIEGWFHIPVSRIDAAGMLAVGGAGSTFSSGYLAGVQVYQAIPEGEWLRRYLTNDIAYRRQHFSFDAKGRIDTGWLNSSAIPPLNTSVTWTTGAAASSFAGISNLLAYVGFEIGLSSPNFITADGTPSFFLLLDVFKSYHMDEEGSGQHLRRPLFPGWIDRPLALVTTWGTGFYGANPYWAGATADSTIADFITSSVSQSSGAPRVAKFYRHWINGDLTLPCDSITGNPRGSTAATTLHITP